MSNRLHANTVMQDKASAQPAISSFCQQMQRWLQQYPHLSDPVSCSAAFLSVAHVVSKAETLGVTAQATPAIEALNAALLQKTMSQIHVLQHWALSNILWALARTGIVPDHTVPGCEEALMSRIVATEASANAQGASSVLWSSSTLGLEPGNGDLIRSCLDTIERGIKTIGNGVESLSVAMGALPHMKLHFNPALAELIVTRVYQALLEGVLDPQAIANVVRACANLGLDRSMGWSLAMLGALDMSFFTRIMLRQMSSDPGDKMVDQLHRALQSLMPHDQSSPAYSAWKHMKQRVQSVAPLLETLPTNTQSVNEKRTIHYLHLMGYEVIQHCDSGDGLHFIDAALLPSATVPCKIAIEMDSPPHFLYEDFRLDKGPNPATRPDGGTLYRSAMLRRQGWQLVIIPWFEERDVKHPCVYLQSKIDAAIVQHHKETRDAKNNFSISQ